MLENTIKGWVTSLAGIIGVILITLHATGVYEFPNPAILHKSWQIGIGYLICGGLFFIPYNKIESYFERAWDLLLGLFRKKVGVEDKKEEKK